MVIPGKKTECVFFRALAALVLAGGLIGCGRGEPDPARDGPPPKGDPLAGPGKQPGGEEAARQVRDSLRTLGRAMRDYHDVFNSFPPAATADAVRMGQPPRLRLSWRVLLLPYLNEGDLFKQFKLDQPWDSPANRPLLAKMPKVFAPPRLPGKEDVPGHTYYQVFTAASLRQPPVFQLPGVFGTDVRCRVTNIVDGVSITLLVTEAARAVPWTKPEDLPYAPDLPLPELGHAVPGAFHACTADGKVWTISKRGRASVLRALITRAGGEVVPDLGDLAPEKFPAAGEETGRVTGKVTFQGQPLATGWVMFHGPEGQEAAGAIGPDGAYRVTGVLVGTARVTVVTAVGEPGTWE